MRAFAILTLMIVMVPTTSAQSSKQIFPNPNPGLPFSAAVKADGLIYVSGTLGRRRRRRQGADEDRCSTTSTRR